MNKIVLLVTGTPCVGKTTVAQHLAKRLYAFYINLTEFAKTHNLSLREDKERKTTIVDEQMMLIEIRKTIDATDERTIVVDGHYAAAVVPNNLVTRVFVMRRNPVELRSFMEACGYTGSKLWENLASEILDVCLVEALQEQDNEKVCELDVTGKTVEAVVNLICLILDENLKCYFGCVDWLGMLERKGLTDEYLRI
jgi:adenylate kinase